MRLKHKKGIVALTVVLVVAFASIAAYAFWTTSGAGSGSVDNAATNGTLALHADWAADALYPGGSQVVTFSADNTNATDLQVGTIHSVVSVTNSGTGAGQCNPAWFHIADVVSNQVVPHNTSGVVLANTGTLVFDNSLAVNQDGCKGETVTLTLSS